jgi:hypothetical protein
MNESSSLRHKVILTAAVAYGALMGFLAYVAMHYPWHVTGTLLDMSGKVDMISFMAREFIPFLQMSSTWVMVWSVAGACVGLIVFVVLWRRQGKAVWRLGCPLVTLLLAIPIGFILIFTQAYIRSRYVWPVQEYGLAPPVPMLVISALLATIPGLLCLTPIGLILGFGLHAIMRDCYRCNTN